MQNNYPSSPKPLRLWPGVVLLIIQWLARFVVPLVAPGAQFYGLMTALFSGVAILLWWLFFSRAPWKERLIAVLLMFGIAFGTYQFLHVSIAKGAMGMLFPILVIPFLSLALVGWAMISRRFAPAPRYAVLILFLVIASGGWTLIRTGGFSGSGDNDFAWRWSETPEERLLAQEPQAIRPVPPATPQAPPQEQTQSQTFEAAEEPSSSVTQTSPEQTQPQTTEQEKPADQQIAQTHAEWPGFRGPERDSIIRGVQIKTDWSASPPKEIWRRPIGPGWSSFAVQGNLFYTQEQRGEEEMVACYNATTGEPVWRHGDSARFWESNAGAGPRGTPQLSNGHVYTLGATGIVNALDATSGAVIWSRNAATDSNTKTPFWGYSGSPLVIDDTVIVAASGKLVGYDSSTGKPKWVGPEGGTDYSSPHQMTIDGVTQVLFMNRPGTISVSPNDGKILWKHALPEGTRIVQPAVIADGDILISDGDQRGMRRITVTRGSNGWNVRERWTTIGMKPYFSDFVVHNEFAYGFDGNYVSCIDLKDGSRKWKGGRYGSGQLILLADQNLLLVLSEKGELALVNAKPEQFSEVSRFPAIKGKTWNHPVLVNDVLLVRNGEEMAAFRLALTGK